MIEIQEYVDVRGHIPYRDWLTKLDTSARVRIITTVLRMQDGNFSNAKGVGSGVMVYFGKDGDRIVLLLTGGSKKRQQTDMR
jgi:putative addiction module killer protein